MSRVRAFLTWVLLLCALSSSPWGSLDQVREYGVSSASIPSGSTRAGDGQAHRFGSEVAVDDGFDDRPPGAPTSCGPFTPDDVHVGGSARCGAAIAGARTILTYRANAPPGIDLT